jgi:ribosomal protein L15E
LDPQRERDEFKRIELTARLQRARDLIMQYEEGLAFYRGQVEDNRYELGRLDERLRGERS